jgi:hypothetical protein
MINKKDPGLGMRCQFSLWLHLYFSLFLDYLSSWVYQQYWPHLILSATDTFLSLFTRPWSASSARLRYWAWWHWLYSSLNREFLLLSAGMQLYVVVLTNWCRHCIGRRCGEWQWSVPLVIWCCWPYWRGGYWACSVAIHVVYVRRNHRFIQILLYQLDIHSTVNSAWSVGFLCYLH